MRRSVSDIYMAKVAPELWRNANIQYKEYFVRNACIFQTFLLNMGNRTLKTKFKNRFHGSKYYYYTP